MEDNYINHLLEEEVYEDIFKDFDFTLLDTTDFKEDSVREEIILPILRKLGYSASGENKIIRSKTLKYPFHHIGTSKSKILIPDYTFEINGENRWVLDAKSPNQNIVADANVNQVYSYAVHREIRSDLFCLCNGREFSIFDVKKLEPLLHFNIKDLKIYWNQLVKYLSPKFIKKPHLRDFSLDFGLFLFKIGNLETWAEPMEFVLNDLSDIAMIEDNLYSINDVFIVNDVIGNEINEIKGQKFMITFDFDRAKYESLLEILPIKFKSQVVRDLKTSPFRFQKKHDENICRIKITAFRSEVILTNTDENYSPFEVIKFELL